MSNSDLAFAGRTLVSRILHRTVFYSAVITANFLLINSTSVFAKVLYSGIEVSDDCDFDADFDFSGRAYFCFKSPSLGRQLFVSHGGQLTTEAITNFGPDEAKEIRTLFKTNKALFFVVRKGDNDWSLWKTNGTVGNYRKVGAFCQPRTRTMTASSGGYIGEIDGNHFVRCTNRIYMVDERRSVIKLVGYTTLVTSLYYSDVALFDNHLYFVSSSNPGYWDTLKKVNSLGISSTISRVDNIDVAITKSVNQQGFIILGFDAIFAYTYVGANDELIGVSQDYAPVGTAGNLFLLWNKKDKLYSTTDFRHLNFLGNYSLKESGNLFINAAQRCDNLTFLTTETGLVISDGSAGGTYLSGFNSATCSKQRSEAVMSNTANELTLISQSNPTGEALAAPPYDIIDIEPRDSNSYYVFTKDENHSDQGTAFQLWLVGKNIREPRLLSTHYRPVSVIGTEGSRLFFRVDTYKYDGIYKRISKVWHSNGSPESTYRLDDPGSARQVPSWLSNIIKMILD